jgi:SAM-dependent methyltransferase
LIWERRHGPRTAPELRAAYNRRHARGLLRDRDRFYRMVRRRIPAGEGAALLDVGCGGGFLLREAEGLRAVGVEISDVALEMARRTAPQASLVLAPGERLPFRAGAFDVVVCLGNLEHFLDPGLGVREMARVLQPAGEAWLLLPNSFYSGDLWRVLRTGYGPDHHQPVERFATLCEWRDFLEAGGLRVIHVHPYNRFKWWKRLLPRTLAYHFLFRCKKTGDSPSSGCSDSSTNFGRAWRASLRGTLGTALTRRGRQRRHFWRRQ